MVCRPETDPATGQTVERITSRATFRRFRSEGRRVRRGSLTVVGLPRTGGVAVAYAVPRRVGTAVQRNKVRRRARAAVQHLAAAGAVPEGDHLVIISKEARERSVIELSDDLAAAWAATPAPADGVS